MNTANKDSNKNTKNTSTSVVGKMGYMLFSYGSMQKGIGYVIKDVGKDYYVMGNHYHVPKKFVTLNKPVVKVYEDRRDDRDDDRR